METDARNVSMSSADPLPSAEPEPMEDCEEGAGDEGGDEGGDEEMKAADEPVPAAPRVISWKTIVGTCALCFEPLLRPMQCSKVLTCGNAQRCRKCFLLDPERTDDDVVKCLACKERVKHVPLRMNQVTEGAEQLIPKAELARLQKLLGSAEAEYQLHRGLAAHDIKVIASLSAPLADHPRYFIAAAAWTVDAKRVNEREDVRARGDLWPETVRTMMLPDGVEMWQAETLEGATKTLNDNKPVIEGRSLIHLTFRLGSGSYVTYLVPGGVDDPLSNFKTRPFEMPPAPPPKKATRMPPASRGFNSAAFASLLDRTRGTLAPASVRERRRMTRADAVAQLPPRVVSAAEVDGVPETPFPLAPEDTSDFAWMWVNADVQWVMARIGHDSVLPSYPGRMARIDHYWRQTSVHVWTELHSPPPFPAPETHRWCLAPGNGGWALHELILRVPQRPAQRALPGHHWRQDDGVWTQIPNPPRPDLHTSILKPFSAPAGYWWDWVNDEVRWVLERNGRITSSHPTARARDGYHWRASNGMVPEWQEVQDPPEPSPPELAPFTAPPGWRWHRGRRAWCLYPAGAGLPDDVPIARLVAFSHGAAVTNTYYIYFNGRWELEYDTGPRIAPSPNMAWHYASPAVGWIMTYPTFPTDSVPTRRPMHRAHWCQFRSDGTSRFVETPDPIDREQPPSRSPPFNAPRDWQWHRGQHVWCLYPATMPLPNTAPIDNEYSRCYWIWYENAWHLEVDVPRFDPPPVYEWVYHSVSIGWLLSSGIYELGAAPTRRPRLGHHWRQETTREGTERFVEVPNPAEEKGGGDNGDEDSDTTTTSDGDPAPRPPGVPRPFRAPRNYAWAHLGDRVGWVLIMTNHSSINPPVLSPPPGHHWLQVGDTWEPQSDAVGVDRDRFTPFRLTPGSGRVWNWDQRLCTHLLMPDPSAVPDPSAEIPWYSARPTRPPRPGAYWYWNISTSTYLEIDIAARDRVKRWNPVEVRYAFQNPNIVPPDFEIGDSRVWVLLSRDIGWGVISVDNTNPLTPLPPHRAEPGLYWTKAGTGHVWVQAAVIGHPRVEYGPVPFAANEARGGWMPLPGTAGWGLMRPGVLIPYPYRSWSGWRLVLPTLDAGVGKYWYLNTSGNWEAVDIAGYESIGRPFPPPLGKEWRFSHRLGAQQYVLMPSRARRDHPPTTQDMPMEIPAASTYYEMTYEDGPLPGTGMWARELYSLPRVAAEGEDAEPVAETAVVEEEVAEEEEKTRADGDGDGDGDGDPTGTVPGVNRQVTYVGPFAAPRHWAWVAGHGALGYGYEPPAALALVPHRGHEWFTIAVFPCPVQPGCYWRYDWTIGQLVEDCTRDPDSDGAQTNQAQPDPPVPGVAPFGKHWRKFLAPWPYRWVLVTDASWRQTIPEQLPTVDLDQRTEDAWELGTDGLFHAIDYALIRPHPRHRHLDPIPPFRAPPGLAWVHVIPLQCRAYWALYDVEEGLPAGDDELNYPTSGNEDGSYWVRHRREWRRTALGPLMAGSTMNVFSLDAVWARAERAAAVAEILTPQVGPVAATATADALFPAPPMAGGPTPDGSRAGHVQLAAAIAAGDRDRIVAAFARMSDEARAEHAEVAAAIATGDRDRVAAAQARMTDTGQAQLATATAAPERTLEWHMRREFGFYLRPRVMPEGFPVTPPIGRVIGPGEYWVFSMLSDDRGAWRWVFRARAEVETSFGVRVPYTRIMDLFDDEVGYYKQITTTDRERPPFELDPVWRLGAWTWVEDCQWVLQRNGATPPSYPVSWPHAGAYWDYDPNRPAPAQNLPAGWLARPFRALMREVMTAVLAARLQPRAVLQRPLQDGVEVHMDTTRRPYPFLFTYLQPPRPTPPFPPGAQFRWWWAGNDTVGWVLVPRTSHHRWFRHARGCMPGIRAAQDLVWTYNEDRRRWFEEPGCEENEESLRAPATGIGWPRVDVIPPDVQAPPFRIREGADAPPRRWAWLASAREWGLVDSELDEEALLLDYQPVRAAHFGQVWALDAATEGWVETDLDARRRAYAVGVDGGTTIDETVVVRVPEQKEERGRTTAATAVAWERAREQKQEPAMRWEHEVGRTRLSIGDIYRRYEEHMTTGHRHQWISELVVKVGSVNERALNPSPGAIWKWCWDDGREISFPPAADCWTWLVLRFGEAACFCVAAQGRFPRDMVEIYDAFNSLNSGQRMRVCANIKVKGLHLAPAAIVLNRLCIFLNRFSRLSEEQSQRPFLHYQRSMQAVRAMRPELFTEVPRVNDLCLGCLAHVLRYLAVDKVPRAQVFARRCAIRRHRAEGGIAERDLPPALIECREHANDDVFTDDEEPQNADEKEEAKAESEPEPEPGPAPVPGQRRRRTGTTETGRASTRVRLMARSPGGSGDDEATVRVGGEVAQPTPTPTDPSTAT